MSNRTVVPLAIAAVVAAGSVLPAQASTISYSYSGTVSSGTDNSNMFGGGNLAGASITISAYYDPSAYATTMFDRGGPGTYDMFFNDTAGASYVSVTLTTLSSQTYTRTLTSGGAFIGNDFLYASAGVSGTGVYGVMTGFGATEATLQPQLFSPGAAWTSGTTIYAAPANVTSMFLVASSDATNGSLTDNISITGVTQNNPAPEPATLSVLGAGVAALAFARRRRTVCQPV